MLEALQAGKHVLTEGPPGEPRLTASILPIDLFSGPALPQSCMAGMHDRAHTPPGSPLDAISRSISRVNINCHVTMGPARPGTQSTRSVQAMNASEAKEMYQCDARGIPLWSRKWCHRHSHSSLTPPSKTL